MTKETPHEPPPLSPAEASAQRLAPFVRGWEPANHDPRDWPQHAPRIAKRDDPWRGHRFFRDLIAMQEERRRAYEARQAEAQAHPVVVSGTEPPGAI